MNTEELSIMRHVVALITALGDDDNPGKAFADYLFGIEPALFVNVLIGLGAWARVGAELMAGDIGIGVERFLEVGSVQLEVGADDE